MLERNDRMIKYSRQTKLTYKPLHDIYKYIKSYNLKFLVSK